MPYIRVRGKTSINNANSWKKMLSKLFKISTTKRFDENYQTNFSNTSSLILQIWTKKGFLHNELSIEYIFRFWHKMLAAGHAKLELWVFFFKTLPSWSVASIPKGFPLFFLFTPRSDGLTSILFSIQTSHWNCIEKIWQILNFHKTNLWLSLEALKIFQ